MSAPSPDMIQTQQPTMLRIVLTYVNHVLIALAAIAISQMSLLVQTDPEWGVMLAERPWLRETAIVLSAVLGVILYRYSKWAKIHLGVHHRNGLLLLVLSALLAWLLLTPLP